MNTVFKQLARRRTGIARTVCANKTVEFLEGGNFFNEIRIDRSDYRAKFYVGLDLREVKKVAEERYEQTLTEAEAQDQLENCSEEELLRLIAEEEKDPSFLKDAERVAFELRMSNMAQELHNRIVEVLMAARDLSERGF